MPTLQHGDVSLNYQTFGNPANPALIFSNSLGTTYSMWQPQIDALQNDFYIIAYDTRGHGGSTAPDQPFTIEQLGDDVVALLDHLQVKQAHFCGISMGGLTGQWLAIHRPEHFSKIVVSNTAAKIGNEAAWKDRVALVREQGLQPIADTAAGRWFTPSFIDAHPDVIAAMSQDLANGSAFGYANCCEALAVADLRTEIKDTKTPLMVVVGTEDPVTTLPDGEYIQSQVAGSQLATVAASHIANIEKPTEFTQILRDFFA